MTAFIKKKKKKQFTCGSSKESMVYTNIEGKIVMLELLRNVEYICICILYLYT